MENTNKQLAEKACQLCKTAIEKGDYDLARIYILNAITHDARMEYFDKLIEIVKKTSPDSMKRDVAKQTWNILSMALFQNEPDDIVRIQAMMDDLEPLCDDMSDSDEDAQESEGVQDSEFAELEQYSWKNLKKNGKLEDIAVVQEKMETLQQFLNLNSGVLDETQKKTAEQGLFESVSFYDYLTKKKALDETLQEIEKEEIKIEGHNVFFLAAKLQNASSIMAQMWLLDVSSVLDSRPLLSEYAEKIQKLEKKYHKLRSHQLWLELKEKAEDAKKKASKSKDSSVVSSLAPRKKILTQILESLQKSIQEISSSLYELTDTESVQDIQISIQSLGKMMEEISQRRFAEYQRWVAEKCRNAIKDYDDSLHVSSSDASNFLKDYCFAIIDESLLSPEAASIFHEAKGLLINKLSIQEKASFQVECVTSEKIKLEDF